MENVLKFDEKNVCFTTFLPEFFQHEYQAFVRKIYFKYINEIRTY